MIEVSYNPEKSELHSIHLAIAKVGHDTKLHKADNNVYDKLPGCCKFERMTSTSSDDDSHAGHSHGSEGHKHQIHQAQIPSRGSILITAAVITLVRDPGADLPGTIGNVTTNIIDSYCISMPAMVHLPGWITFPIS